MIVYAGIDVHKDTNTICLYCRKNNAKYELGTITAGTEYVLKALKKAKKDFFAKEEIEWRAGYEAGPTGYGLCKGLIKRGVNCQIMAPTTIIRASGKKTKTDRRDAADLAMALANDTYKAVHLLDDEDMATREITRLRGAVVKKIKKEKQNLLSFLLRLGKTYPEAGKYWTLKHWAWLDTLIFDDVLMQYSLKTYIAELKNSLEVLERINAKIEGIAQTDRYRENVQKLVCFAGIQTHTAVSILCEIGDFARFTSAEQFSSYIGIVPGQESSGLTQRYTGITKTGNSRIRLLLIEAAQGIKNSSPYGKSKRLQLRQAQAAPDIVNYADRGTKRIRLKMDRLIRNAKKVNVAITAGARELSCFVWGMMTGNIA